MGYCDCMDKVLYCGLEPFFVSQKNKSEGYYFGTPMRVLEKKYLVLHYINIPHVLPSFNWVLFTINFDP